jgi:DNA-binding response OmpR family regulator
MDGITVLVIEDEVNLRDAMVSYLNLENAFSVGVGDLACANKWLARNTPDFIVIDLNLKGEDGLAWLEETTLSPQSSVIIASARGEVLDRVSGFKLGIASYLIKPIALEELTAIICNIHFKKINLQNDVPQSQWTLSKLDWTLKHRSHSDPIQLTKLEELLIKRLAQEPGESVNKQELILAIDKNEDSYDFRSLEVLIRRLRQKLEPLSGEKSKPIKTIHSIGYSFIESIEVI